MPQAGMCSTCQHYDATKEYAAGSVAGLVGQTRIDLPPNEECGTCRFHPPVASATGPCVWPIVRADGWCSQWKANAASVFEKAVPKPGKTDRRMG